jgi:DNA polymerase I-like protein with 3'-5' exonuclease and polymerase domains
MLAHHLLFPGTPKGLDYLSSLYCRHHWYWKEDHKEWDMRGSIEQLLAYNATDCIRNYEVNTVLRSLIPKMGMEAQWAERRENNALALSMMRRGVRIDREHRALLAFELSAAADDLSRWFSSIVPQSEVAPDAKVPWFASPTQQRIFFGSDLGLRLPLHRKTGNETFGKEALTILSERHPEFTRLFDMLGEFRSIRTFHNNFIKADLDPDERMRCMFNTAGTETFRWSSSTNAFGAGTNLQNIPKGEED